MTHLRQAMLDELQRRNYAKTTVQYYIQAVERFARHFHRPPDQLNQTLCSPKTPELCSPTFGAVLRELSSWAGRRQLSGVSERSMMIRVTTTSRLQQRYDHRLRALVQRTGNIAIATDLGVPRSTARG